tara:strand:+ start:942 stop:1250 length:309 start_codon:yes stop_codon:yes gene_type:complete
MKLNMENADIGIIKIAPVGFSWTTFFFGPLPALFRGDIKWGIIMILAAGVTFGVSSLIFCFIYNKLFIQDLITKGYKVKSVEAGTIESAKAKLGINLPELSQ